MSRRHSSFLNLNLVALTKKNWLSILGLLLILGSFYNFAYKIPQIEEEIEINLNRLDYFESADILTRQYYNQYETQSAMLVLLYEENPDSDYFGLIEESRRSALVNSVLGIQGMALGWLEFSDDFEAKLAEQEAARREELSAKPLAELESMVGELYGQAAQKESYLSRTRSRIWGLREQKQGLLFASVVLQILGLVLNQIGMLMHSDLLHYQKV